MSGTSTERRPWELTWTPAFVGVPDLHVRHVTTKFWRVATLTMAVPWRACSNAGASVPSFSGCSQPGRRGPGFWGSGEAADPDQVWPNLIEQGKLLLVALVPLTPSGRRPNPVFSCCFLLLSYLLFPVRATLVNYATGYRVFGRALGRSSTTTANDLAAVTVLMLGAGARTLLAN